MKKIIYNSNSEIDTQEIAEKIAQNLGGYKVLSLHGELGSGKTTFVKTFAKSLGIESRIISPTFVIMRQYNLPKKGKLYHIDAYRLSGKDINDLELIQEVLDNEDSVVVIEWAERIEKILPPKRIDISFYYTDKKDARKIEIIKQE